MLISANGAVVVSTANVPTNAAYSGGIAFDPVTGAMFVSSSVGALSTANTTAAATANVTAIQAALTAGGLVQITTPGKYRFNSSLTMYDRTTLVLGAGVELVAIPTSSATFPGIVNSNYNSTPITISTITAATFGHFMVRVTVTFGSAHGLVAGNFVEIKGDGADIYNGVWEIDTAPSATTLTFIMSIASGSTLAPPDAAVSVASASQTVATPGVFTTGTNAFFKGQAVTITGTPPGGFATGTTYYVIGTGLTTTTCQLADSPFATTGKQVTSSSACTVVPALQGSPANGYIQILGPGKLNMNFAGGSFVAAGTYADHGIIMRRVLEPVVENLVIQDVRKYCVMMQDTQSARVQGLHVDSGSDGVHIYGPAWNPLIENLTGTTGDDSAIFQTIDGDAYVPYMLGTGFDLGGNFYGGTMRNIRTRHIHNSGACVIYPNGNTGGTGRTNAIYAMRGQILIDGGSTQDPVVSGNWSGGNSVMVGGGYSTIAGTIDTLTIRNTQIPNLFNNGGSLITINNMTWDGITNDQFNGTNASVNMDVITVNNFTINSANITNINSNTLIYLRTVNATIKNLVFNGGIFTQSGSGAFSLVGSNGGNLDVCTFNNVTVSGVCKYVTEGNGLFVGTPTFIFNGGYGQSGYGVAVASTGAQNMNVYMNGFKSVSPSVGLFNFFSYTGTLNLRIVGLDYSGGLFANLTGSNNSIYNPDGSCPVDLSKVARTAGSIAKCASGNGTIVANNLAVCDATGAANSWKQLSNTTLVY